MARRTSRKTVQTLRWKKVRIDSGVLSAGSLSVTALAAEEFPDTVMRTRGELAGFVSGVQAPGALVSWAFGLVCVPEGTGATVIWSPITDGNAPWFVYATGHLGYEEYVADVVQAVALSSFRMEIDSKAMRKCPPDMELQAVFQQSSVGTAADIRIAFTGRILLGR